MRLPMRSLVTLLSRAVAAGWLLLAVSASASASAAASPRLLVVAAENFYGDIARQIAGPAAQVVSILQNPDADPHLFEPDTATARMVADANVLIFNGLNYDPWIERLLRTHARHTRQTLRVATLMHQGGPDANPHLWYDPATMPALARALAAQLVQLDPAHADSYAQRLALFLHSLQPLQVQIAQLHRQYAGAPVTATEPVADDLTAAIGLSMRNSAFQLAIMNDSEPGPRETAAFEQSLRAHAVRLLIYNRQTSGGTTQRLLSIARQAGIALVGVSETEPVGLDYQQWMLSVLTHLHAALAEHHP
jgi:zinc/manganese transport system substrate-binding protein